MALTWITAADTQSPSGAMTESAIEAACWILYKLTAEKYPGITERHEWYGREGNCVTCLGGFIEGSEYFQSTFSFHGHVWYSSPEVRRIRLRGYPVRTVDFVKYNGETLDPTSYRIENKKYLVRADNLCWNTDIGIEISYTAGIAPPEAGRQAAIRLANEFILANTDPDACALPERVTSISRQGVDYTLLDAQDFLQNGRTGIYEIDIFIKAANPTNAKKKPRVFSVDLPSGNTRL